MPIETSSVSTSGDVPHGPHSRNRWLFAGELAALAALTVADTFGLVPLSRTPFLLLLGWLSLRLRRLRWRDVGFRPPPALGRALLLGLAAGVAMELLAMYVTTPMIASMTGRLPDFTEFRSLAGNLPLLVVLIVVSWILAAFGEELAFRGYLMSRVADAFQGTRAGWVFSLVLVSIFFGIGHSTQGMTGIIQESISGLLLGVLFIASGFNLTVPIVAHGVSNTIALVLLYLGKYPMAS